MRQRPLIGLQPKRRSSALPRNVFLALLAIGGGYLWLTEIAGDLESKDYQGKHIADAAPTAKPGGPARLAPPPRELEAGLGLTSESSDDRVRRALIVTAKDHVARRVVPTVGPVMSMKAIKGCGVDMMERALEGVGVPLRTAVVLHRFRHPSAYGLRRRPQATESERRRALSADNLKVFFQHFGRQLPTTWRSDRPDTFQHGDIVLVKNGAKGRVMFAVVGERTNSDGALCLYTLDPRDKHARDDRSLADYDVVAHFRFGQTELNHVRRALPMGVPREPRGRRL